MPRTVLFADHSSAIGGAEQVLLLLLDKFDRSRWNPVVACPDGTLARRILEIGVPVRSLDFPRLRSSPSFVQDWLQESLRLAQASAAVDAAIIHANTLRAALYTAPAARLARRKFVWHMHDFWITEAHPRRLWPDRLVKQALCNSASAVITVSQAVADRLPCSGRATVVHNGIDTSQFDPHAGDNGFRHAHSIPAQAPLVGMVGRLRPWKGQERFLHMAAEITAARPDVRFVIVGGDPFQVANEYAERLMRLAIDLGVAERTTFTGQIDDVRPALAAMDVFVHPGDPEPFGLVNIEAMAMAKPVVAFAHGAIPEIVENGATGMLVAPYDIPELARKVRILLNEPGYARALGDSGRRLALRRFDVTIAAQRVQSIYQRLLETP